MIGCGLFSDKEFDYDVAAVTKRLKEIVNQSKGGTYIAGSLIIHNPGQDLLTKEDKELLIIDVEPLDDVDEELKEACYYVSVIYVRCKSDRAAFYNQASRNIEQYKNIKKMSDFINVEGEFGEA